MGSKQKRAQTGRAVAREVLRRVRRDGSYANLALSGAFERARSLSAQERNLATELTYGVLRYQRVLDHAWSRHVSHSRGHLDEEVLDAMRLAVYQILKLDRIPAYAAVNDAVEVVRHLRGRVLAGFVNAVLRKVNAQDLLEGLPTDPVSRMALECSLPDPLVELWIRQLGLEETHALGTYLLQRAPLTLRVNSIKTDRIQLGEVLSQEGAHFELSTLAPDALRVSGLDSPFIARSYLDGLWTAQDEAAQLVAHLVDPQPGEIIFDACAGVGGKSTHLAALMKDAGQVLCVDISTRKLELLQEHCLRLGIRSCTFINADVSQWSCPGDRPLDRILLDAPCSGLGVLRRHPELKWRFSLETLPRLVELQRALLKRVASLLRPGGILVYSVCTTTDEEGPQQVAWLLEHFPDLELWPPTSGPLSNLASQGVFRLWPHRHQTDGFFMARFRRKI